MTISEICIATGLDGESVKRALQNLTSYIPSGLVFFNSIDKKWYGYACNLILGSSNKDSEFVYAVLPKR